MKMDFVFLTLAEEICFLLVLTQQNMTIFLTTKIGGAENAGQDIAGQDNDGQTGRA